MFKATGNLLFSKVKVYPTLPSEMKMRNSVHSGEQTQGSDNWSTEVEWPVKT